jgi:hypothetical protein
MGGLVWGIWRLPNSGNNLGIWFLKTVYGILAGMECWGYAAMQHSLIGLSFYHHFKPTTGHSRRRVTAVITIQIFLFLAAGMLIANLTSGWWFGHYEARSWPRLEGGLIVTDHFGRVRFDANARARCGRNKTRGPG